MSSVPLLWRRFEKPNGTNGLVISFQSSSREFRASELTTQDWMTENSRLPTGKPTTDYCPTEPCGRSVAVTNREPSTRAIHRRSSDYYLTRTMYTRAPGNPTFPPLVSRMRKVAGGASGGRLVKKYTPDPDCAIVVTGAPGVSTRKG